jgi:hypothetical protein
VRFSPDDRLKPVAGRLKRPRYWPEVVVALVSGASGGTSRYWRSNLAMSLNAGAATLPP